MTDRLYIAQIRLKAELQRIALRPQYKKDRGTEPTSLEAMATENGELRLQVEALKAAFGLGALAP